MSVPLQSARLAAVAARPLSELLDCSPDIAGLLSGAAQSLTCAASDRVFQQGDAARGLYLVVAGEFLRESKRLNKRLNLGLTRPGEVVELAAALSAQQHTYTLTALTPGTLLLLPLQTLHQAFDRHPPLRMRLLEELAREVSRAYLTSSASRIDPKRRHPNSAPQG